MEGSEQARVDVDLAQRDSGRGPNMPFGHAMTRRAREVTVPVYTVQADEAATAPRSIPVEGPPSGDTSVDVGITPKGEGERAA